MTACSAPPSKHRVSDTPTTSHRLAFTSRAFCEERCTFVHSPSRGQLERPLSPTRRATALERPPATSRPRPPFARTPRRATRSRRPGRLLPSATAPAWRSLPTPTRETLSLAALRQRLRAPVPLSGGRPCTLTCAPTPTSRPAEGGCRHPFPSLPQHPDSFCVHPSPRPDVPRTSRMTLRPKADEIKPKTPRK